MTLGPGPRGPSWFSRGGRGNSGAFGGPQGDTEKGPVWQSIRAPPGPGTAGGLLVPPCPGPAGVHSGRLEQSSTGRLGPGWALGWALGCLPGCRAASSLGEVLRVPWRSEKFRAEAVAARRAWSVVAAGEARSRAGRGSAFSPVCARSGGGGPAWPGACELLVASRPVASEGALTCGGQTVVSVGWAGGWGVGGRGPLHQISKGAGHLFHLSRKTRSRG